MDCFNTIPIELRLAIIENLDNRQDVASLGCATPSMATVQIAWKPTICRKRLQRLLTPELVQDAMAVILFPRTKGSIGRSDNSVVISLLRGWAKNTLPDPLQEGDHQTVVEMDGLIERIDILIGDYISKATSTCLPRAHLHLPWFSHPSYTEFHEPISRTQRLTVADLSEAEYHRLLRAFLYYELTCKAHPIIPGFSAQGSTHVQEIDWRNGFLSFVGEERSINLSDIDMIQCVHEYVRTLHGAMAARMVDGGLDVSGLYREEDGDLKEFRSVGTLLFPDDRQFNAELYLEIPQTDCGFTVLDYLSSCGLDLAFYLLLSPIKETKLFFNAFYTQTSVLEPLESQRNSRRPPISPTDSALNQHDPLPGNWKAMSSIFHGNWIDRELLKQAYVRMMRQRAWPFFDDFHHYKNRAAPTSFKAFLAASLNIEYTFDDPDKSRIGARGCWPTLKISEGAMEGHVGLEYPALESMGQTRFWQ